MTGPNLQVEKAVYGGDGLVRTAEGEVLFVPFVLPGEQLAATDGGRNPATLVVVEAAPERVAPSCIHFGVCGGCQYQMASYNEQLRLKQAILAELLQRADLIDVPPPHIWSSPEPWGYRNRVRFRIREVDGALRLGYNVRGTKEFLPIRMCPIASPLLWAAAEALMRLATASQEAQDWLRAADEVELACDDAASKVQLHLLCTGAIPQRKMSFPDMAKQLVALGTPLASAGASRYQPASGRATEALAGWGPEGITYHVGEDRFWLKRGGFFQVNRFLLSTIVDLVCANRQGALAWDLFSGVGLFARRLGRQFQAVTAVEANQDALPELRRGLARPADHAIQETTLSFLRKAVVQRERPELIVLDPPRAGAGEEACRHLLALRPAEIVYVSCDPTTLTRDAKVLAAGYRVAELHMVDLFPQTYHLETVMVLRRRDVQL